MRWSRATCSLCTQLCLRIANTSTSHPENDTEKKELNGNDKVDTTTAQNDAPADVSKSDPVAPAATTTTTTTESESKTDAKAEKEAEKKAEEKVEEPVSAVAADKKVAEKVGKITVLGGLDGLLGQVVTLRAEKN